MNKLSSRERKIAYFVGILVLLIPIVVLGMPSGGTSNGGVLARMRTEKDLGEASLGRVDPTSATMNLLLLGLRGVAVNLLRMDLDYYKDHKEWAKMRATTESVIMLQPHYIEVWRFLSWNLAFNVSAEWDAVPDRYFWVKEGGKFSQRGTQRNQDVPELFWDTGRNWGQKIGRSDEARYFRKYFVSDPNTEQFKGQADPEINPSQKDNYLVAKDWFTTANQKEENRVQHIMMRALFRSYPARSTLDYADALQRDAKYISKENKDEEAAEIEEKFNLARTVFAQAFQEWTQDFGKMEFQTSQCLVKMEADEDDVKALAKASNVTEDVIQHWIDHYQKVSNYRYWRERARAEAETDMAKSHRLLYAGERATKAGELERGRKLLEEGMELYAGVLAKFTELSSEELTVEEGMWAALVWHKTLDLLQKPVPENYPLKKLWDDNQAMLPQLQDRYNSTGY